MLLTRRLDTISRHKSGKRRIATGTPRARYLTVGEIIFEHRRD